MRIEQLEYFVAAAETLSFTEAARRCRVAQPAISQQIHRLEGELGFELFSRGARGLSLTDAGRLYYRDAVETVARLDQARRRAASVACGSTGSLVVGACGPTQGSDLAILRDFMRESPAVELSFCGVNTRRQADQLARGAFDVVYTDVAQMGTLEGVAFAGAAGCDLCLMASRHDPAARRGAGMTFDEACDQTLIFAEPSDAALGPSPFQRGAGKRLYTDTQENVQLMVRLGMGMTIAPEGVATSASDDIRIIPARGDWPRLELGWAYMADNPNPALGAFVAFLRAHAELR